MDAPPEDRLDAVLALKDSPGWAMFMAEVKARLDDHNRALIHDDDGQVRAESRIRYLELEEFVKRWAEDKEKKVRRLISKNAERDGNDGIGQ